MDEWLAEIEIRCAQLRRGLKPKAQLQMLSFKGKIQECNDTITIFITSVTHKTVITEHILFNTVDHRITERVRKPCLIG